MLLCVLYARLPVPHRPRAHIIETAGPCHRYWWPTSSPRYFRSQHLPGGMPGGFNRLAQHTPDLTRLSRHWRAWPPDDARVYTHVPFDGDTGPRLGRLTT